MTTLRVSEVLPRRLRSRVPRWDQLAGATLGSISVPVGVDDSGALRVIAKHDAALHELETRSAHLLAAWNAVARFVGAAEAKTLVCWVNPALEIRAPAPSELEQGARQVLATFSAPPPPDPESMRRASAEMAHVSDPELRQALIRARAKALVTSRGGGTGGGRGRHQRPTMLASAPPDDPGE